jgi:hypothetical protein
MADFSVPQRTWTVRARAPGAEAMATGQYDALMDEPSAPESFSEFRTSFSYGTRNDLNFKFLKSVSDAEAAEFLRQLLDVLGDQYDTGDLGALIDLAIEAQVAGYAPKPDAPPGPHAAETGPFAPLDGPLASARVGLLNTGGHFVDGDDPRPFGIDSMSQEEAVARIGDFLKDTPILSEIPADLEPGRLVTRHGGYDISSVRQDRNVAFPSDRLAEAAANGRIRATADTFFSFPGATAQGRLRRELPGWIDRIGSQATDVMLLVPV